MEGGEYSPWLLQPLFLLYRHKQPSPGQSQCKRQAAESRATLGQSQCSADETTVYFIATDDLEGLYKQLPTNVYYVSCNKYNVWFAGSNPLTTISFFFPYRSAL